MALVKLNTKPIGSIVKINVNNTMRNFIVAHIGRPSSEYDTSFNDTTWLLMQDLFEKRWWNLTAVHDYAASTIHSYLNSEFLNFIDEDIRSAIVQVKVPYRPGSGTSYTVDSGANGLPTKVFLLSGYEVGYTQATSSSAHYLPVDGAKLSYFLQGDGAGSDAADKRIAYLDGKATEWWLRSPQVGQVTGVATCKETGILGLIKCDYSYGIRPAFVLPSTMLVDDDGTLVLNQPPAISGSNTDLGTKTAPFDYKYTVSDDPGQTVTVSEKLTGGGITRTLRTYTAQNGVENTAAIPANWLYVQSGSNQLVITAADSLGESSVRAVTFTRQIGAIDAARAFSTSQKVTKCILSLFPAVQPCACTVEVQVTNNPFDTSPVWEDISAKVGKYVHTFTNTVNANGAGLGVRFRITPSVSGGKVYIDSAVIRFE